ncbi:hypothetical protein DVH24_037856 [Malus domestica]|uniref:Uncharacterized protein n=1 Tax=Malus domestica TaxID=3750 RepID=A0A498JZ78_MALDO|nr:hypothetical protein DVH24_037856 [Malus domestica]
MALGSNLTQIDDGTRLYPDRFSRDLEAIGAIDSTLGGGRERGMGGAVKEEIMPKEISMPVMGWW